MGQSRDTFCVIESTHSVIGVCTMFGSFIKFVVISVADLEAESEEASPWHLTFRLKKIRRINCTKQSISEQGLGWIEPVKYGKAFVIDLGNLLWLIDGHHAVFSSRSCHIPIIIFYSLVVIVPN